MAEFEVVRQAVIAAEPSRIHELIDDFHEWIKWSPWEDLDPQLQRAYKGPQAGVGAQYTWDGNRKAGRGSMEIMSSDDREIGIRIAFEKPFRATNQATFELKPVEAVTGRQPSTEVVWRMTGQQQGIMALFGKVMSMDKLIGKDFEKGLGRLKAVAEAQTA
ncbi:SRPBCC family protein [Nocardia australiensis]|uniref:SRPBCC family protein n=1 Tax=Nocardia australiensis TaxID=2887191 RepID=UPI001D1572A5|nr:SRPBCC family protein [Nocardia australiensis]